MTRAFCGAALMLAGVALGACSPDSDGPPATDACGAAALSGFVGQPAEALRGQITDRPVRVIGPDTMVTMDYLEGRLNLHTDAAGVILQIDCG